MPTVRSFNDSSSVALAYAISNKDSKADFVGGTRVAMKLLPFTTEGFAMQKETKTSTAIRGDRRTTGSKNTKGSANGAVTVEFGANAFILDLLQLALLGTWKDVDNTDPLQGKFITDGELKQYMVVEKTVRQGPTATDRLDHEWYFGTIMNDVTLNFGDGELITLACSTMSANADYGNALAGVDGLGGSAALSKAVPPNYEIADSSNNLANIEIRDENDDLLEVTWSDFSLQIQNNAREQSGLGHQFAAGIGVGKVAVTASGEIYYFDQTILDTHMNNKRVKLKTTVSTAEGTFTIELPNLMAQAPTNNAEGENADYKSAMTLTAEAGVLDIGTNLAVPCVLAITYVPTP
ncbi:hypothetical protein HOV23_gp011 [Pseudomonas phage Lana]|uniref:Uncharacterized protein n=1 Tax=Pseudomonas phage Lana TaxID=2530172 RepID=A0A481W6H3_9CAUD|nr:hypothetical protein HOV23_gp011 [Pseudomonas phage Lana]QBJ04563.1 hypothetical protein [Pseudomonas phage Lana]